MALNGRTAIVTGASRGIGRAIAERLARDGFRVVAHYQHNKEAAEAVVRGIVESGGEAAAIGGDVSVAADVRALFEFAGARGAGVDVVVNNAGVLVGGPVQYTSEEDFDRAVAVNFKSVFLSAQEAVKVLPEGGRIINIAAGLPSGAVPMLGVYGATKVAVEVLTRSLAHQFGPQGITVNAVAPGPTDTDMLSPDARQNLDMIIGATPLRRLGQPADVAAVVSFLAGQDSAWVTGQTLHADGGML
ncbi:SDR family oxidoreductase [Actinoplanes auranticolor]|uniref:3-ketoacyl-ACP reductase n=1 Tax=Actinoplanes auranticolor TaxID=47988 RepID=A0A919SY03_9ACTN|nr:SDR family oxidoreductase [Actinoplanes auranticolor]GIM79427.1 3-ketoacyl-ACP reductase [Actinoplanes auranticolor]